jgi:ABC-type multidrug transport system fused ATPase/permease subunit
MIAGLILSVLISASVWVLSAGNEIKAESHDNVLATFCQWLYDSEIGTGIRESIWVFPIVEGTHLLGIALSVGMLCWFDLRLLGLALRDQPVSKVWQQVMPWALAGFVLMFVTGGLLFWAEAARAYASVHFWIKVVLLVAAGVNALLFETTAHRHIAEWDKAPVPPLRARMTGAISLVLWTAIIITGRTMAYNF